MLKIVISQGVRQGHPISLIFFSIYINEIIIKWTERYTTGIRISKDMKINTLLFTEDQVTICYSEGNVQKIYYVFYIKQHRNVTWKFHSRKPES
jgi:hypothetical protein